jgi:hypothetical protein
MAAAKQSVAARRPVESLIRVIRGYRVMLDADLVYLYGVATKVFNSRLSKVTICDLRERAGPVFEVRSLGVHRAGCCHALSGFAERARCRDEHPDRPGVRSDGEIIAANQELAARIEKLEHRQDRAVDPSRTG